MALLNSSDRIVRNLLHINSRITNEIFEQSSIKEASKKPLNSYQMSSLTLLYSTGRKKMSDFKTLYDVSLPAVTKTIDKLERLGYAKRLLDNSDRRSVWVEITDEGKRVVKIYQQSYLSKVESALENWTEEEKLTFINALQKFMEKAIEIIPTTNVICLQCHGLISESCIVQSHSGTCIYQEEKRPIAEISSSL